MAARWVGLVNRNLFYILCAFPLLPLHWISITTISLLSTGLLYLLLKNTWEFDWRFFAVMVAPVLVMVLFLPASQNIEHGFRSVAVKLVLVGLGTHYAFRSLRASEQEVVNGFAVFSIATVVMIGWTWLQMAMLGFTHPVGFQGADFTFSYRIALEVYAGLHPTYYCAIVYTVAFIHTYQLIHKQTRTKRWVLAGFIVVCSVAGLMAASRATMFAFAIIMTLILVRYLRSHPFRWRYAGALVVVGIGLLFLPPIQNRLREMNVQNLQAPSGHNDNGTNVRAGIFACNASLTKEHWLLGVGPGDVQTALNECLSGFKTHVYQIHDYNTHNEYINYLLTCGLLGLLVFVGVLGYSMFRSIKHKNLLHLYFLVFMSICFLSENYLDRQAGVTFFALMQTLFWMRYPKQTEKL